MDFAFDIVSKTITKPKVTEIVSLCFILKVL